MELIQINAPVDWPTRVNAIAKHARETAKTLTQNRAQAIAGSLTATSKMPCKSYGLPPEQCNVGARLAKVAGSVCSDCYACKGFYKTYHKTVGAAQRKRLASLTHPMWATAMVRMIGAQGKYFRWHDAGDIQSTEHLALIVAVAVAMPEVKFWLPTREYRVVQMWLRDVGAFPSNLIVRCSAAMVDGAAPVQVTGVASAVHTVAPRAGYVACSAPKHNGECRKCRACWNPKIAVVSYHKH